MQETCRFKPPTISRRFSVAAGFYRTCVIDAVLEHSPAEHVRRPNVPAESPTLGFTHLRSSRGVDRSHAQFSAQFVTSVLSRTFIIETQPPSWQLDS